MAGPESLSTGLNRDIVTMPGTTSGTGNIANPTGAPINTPRADTRLPGTTAGPGNAPAPNTMPESIPPGGQD